MDPVVAAPRAPHRRGPPAVAWVLLLAVLVVVAAALLTRPVGALGPSTSVQSGLTVDQVGQVAAILLLIAAGVGLFLRLWDPGGRVPLPSQVVSTLLVIILLLVVFVGVSHLLHFAPISGSGNSTGNATGGTRPLNNSTQNITLPFGSSGITLPAWAGIAVLLGIAVLAAVLLVPALGARAEARRRTQEKPDRPPREAQRAFQETLTRLSLADGNSARLAILALYSRLLLLVRPRLGALESRTPREIERDSIDTLGLRPRVARDLRETFEEARYSTHPMSAEAVERARSALTDAVADLASDTREPP